MPGVIDRATSAVMRTMQRNVYSTELYKRIYLTLRFRLTESKENQQRLEHLETEDALLGRPNADQAAEQKLGNFERLSEEAVNTFECRGMGPPGPPALAASLQGPCAVSSSHGSTRWQGFQALNRAGKYRIVFFVNLAPNECAGADRFTDLRHRPGQCGAARGAWQRHTRCELLA